MENREGQVLYQAEYGWGKLEVSRARVKRETDHTITFEALPGEEPSHLTLWQHNCRRPYRWSKKKLGELHTSREAALLGLLTNLTRSEEHERKRHAGQMARLAEGINIVRRELES